MAFLQLSLLGAFRLTIAGEGISRFRSQREAALLAYLAVEAHQPHPRERLAGLLWPARPENTARQNLRQTLTNLRLQLREEQQESPFLLAERNTLQFNPATDATIDVHTFTAALTTVAAHRHTTLAACAPCLAQLAAAITLYQGPLLTNFTLGDSDLFEEWLFFAREQLHHQAMTALHQLSTVALQQADWAQTLHYARRQVELDPFHEAAHHQLLQALAAQGDRSGALAHFDHLRFRLEQELGVEPSEETERLIEHIRAGANPVLATSGVGNPIAIVPPATVPPAPRWDGGGAATTGLVVGRTHEEAMIRGWLQAGIPIITVLGLAGVGKTTLTQTVARHQAAHFAVVIWRSLLNALPLTTLLAQWLAFLTETPISSLPTDQEQVLSLLFTELRRQRCLLVLDSVERIMLEDRGGRFRPGYEEYGSFFQRMALEQHQSVLLLTSREQPQSLVRLDDEMSNLRSLTLGGLSAAAGQELFRSYGLALTDENAAQLVQRFSGNPMILKFVTNTIQELFDGDMNAFLAEETPVYGDIRDLFDQYRTRIPYREKVILMWLAIHREPMPLAQLRAALRPPVSTSTFLEALHSLQRRALIEQTPTGFTVPDVVMTIMIEYLLELATQEVIEQAEGVLNHYRLIEEGASAEIRQSQHRVIVVPLVERLSRRFGHTGLVAQLQQMLALAQQPSTSPGYLADNLRLLLAYAEETPGH
ncbi:MAG: hypothetical protein KF832_29245 [Caldilineaceae bacterium]|nr:hypothetical protein [Caldilineaceae bacterium]